MPYGLRYIVVKCPICGKEKKERYSLNKESIYRIRSLHYGVRVDETQGSTRYFYIPCDEHEKEFEQRVKEYLEKYRKAESAFRRAVEREISKIRSKIIDEALKELSNQLARLGPNEGIVFWVCEAAHNELDEVREVFAVAYKHADGTIAKLSGSINKPQRAWRKGGHFAWTHYDAQDSLLYVDTQNNISWKGYIQGLTITNVEDLRYILEAIFFWTHENPTYTLVDFLRRQRGSLYHEFAEVIAKYKENADPRFWTIVEKESLEQKVKEKIIKKYGIDPSKTPHVKGVFGV